MLGALQGFATIWAIIGVGWLLAHYRILEAHAQKTLSDLAFFVASPALLLVVLSSAPLEAIFSTHLLVSFLSAVLVMAIGGLIARWRWQSDLGDATMAAVCSGYVNSGNLGLPIAAYVIGDITYAASILFVQLLVFTPISMGILDATSPARHPSRVGRWLSFARNPITLGALLGLLIAVFRIELPAVVLQPITLIGNMAVPGMLLAFGVSLRVGQKPGEAFDRIAVLSGLKLVGHPAAALAIGWAVGLRGHGLYAVGVMAALPTAQNIFTYALRYQRMLFLTRDTILVTTFGSIPVILLLAAVFG